MIREAALSDMEEVVRMAKTFHSHSMWSHLPFDDEAFTATAERMIEAEEGVIYLSEEGICGGLVNGLYFSPSTRIAVELFWYAPAEGTELRQAFERWAKDRGAQAVQFSAQGDGRRAATERLYRMAGYHVCEMAFLKAL